MEYKDNYRLQKAREKVKKLKDFYIHSIVMIIAIPIVVFVNLKFTPQFHWFWIAIWGMVFSVIMHWMGNLKYGKDWENQKIKKILKKDKNNH